MIKWASKLSHTEFLIGNESQHSHAMFTYLEMTSSFRWRGQRAKSRVGPHMEKIQMQRKMIQSAHDAHRTKWHHMISNQLGMYMREQYKTVCLITDDWFLRNYSFFIRNGANKLAVWVTLCVHSIYSHSTQRARCYEERTHQTGNDLPSPTYEENTRRTPWCVSALNLS